MTDVMKEHADAYDALDEREKVKFEQMARQLLSLSSHWAKRNSSLQLCIFLKLFHHDVKQLQINIHESVKSSRCCV